MRAFIGAILTFLALVAAPATLTGQNLGETKVDARVVIPEFLIVNVVDHAVTGEGTGRVELLVSANLNWSLSLATTAAVDYRIVSGTPGKTAQGAPVSRQKVVIEYRHTTNGTTAASPPFEYILAAR